MSALFIADLHLQASRPELSRAFFNFLTTTAANADGLYLLGDIFEYWVGDDDDDSHYHQVIHALAEYSETVPCYFMHGNRDFLVGDQFCRQTGCSLLPDPSVAKIYDESVLLMHGDSLCTQDTEYMQLRQLLRNPQWQQTILSKSLAERKLLAQQLRQQSSSMNSNKAEDIMDVTPSEVTKVMQANNVQLLIHGHTHRPAIHKLELNHQPAERVVLGDWREYGWYYAINNKGEKSLNRFEINT